MGNGVDGTRSKRQKKSWYESRTVVVIFTIFLFPLGVYGLWKSSRFKSWKELGVIGKLWRCCWVFFALGLFSAFWSNEDSTKSNIEQNLQETMNEQSQKISPQRKPQKDVVINASFSRLSNENNTIWMTYYGRIHINLHKPHMRENDQLSSHNDNNVKMIGAEYFHNNEKRYCNNDTGTSIRLTLTCLDYENKRAKFEFEALLQNSLRNNGKSVKVQFELTGLHFENAVKAQVIAADET